MSSEKFNIELTANALQMRQELDKAQKEVKKLRGEVGKTDKSQNKMSLSAKKLAGRMVAVGAAVISASAALTAYATVQGRAIRDTETLATMAGMTVDKFRQLSFAMGTVGITTEKYGDILKDVQERIGDFISSGGGPFMDFADTMGYTKEKTLEMAKEFQNLSGAEVMQEMVNQMQLAGKSTQQMSFTLEGLATNSTRLIPLLKDNGKALGDLQEKFNAVDIPLTEEERQNFKDLADNVDLATESFNNMLQNAIAPLIPKLSELSKESASLFSEWIAEFEVFRLYSDPDKANDIANLAEADALLKAIAARRLRIEEAADLGFMSDDSFAQHIVALANLEDEIELKKLKLKLDKDLKEIEDSYKPETKKGKSGADDIKDKENLEKEMQKAQDAKKTKLQLIREERDERLKILKSYNAKNTEELEKQYELERQIHADYKLKILDATQTNDDQKKQEYTKELAEQREFLSEGLINEEEYQAKRKEIIAEFAPTVLTPELLEEENQKELEALKEKLDAKLILESEYIEALADLETKDAEDKQEREEFDAVMKSDDDVEVDTYSDKLEKLKEFLDEKLITEQEYYERRNEIIAEFAPETIDAELFEEKNQKELEALKAQFEQKLILEKEYLEKVQKLQKKDLKDKEEKTKKENFWSDSTTKNQLDQGTQLLQTLGNNSKTAHKIKQGLAVANAGMNTAEGVTKALADQNYVGAALTAATGVAQIAAILSSTPDGGGGNISAPSAAPQEQPQESVDVQETTITDISGGSQSSSQVFTLEFSDDVVDVLARKVEQAKSDGRI